MENINIPRSEYPRPQFVRESYINLNGQWQFAMDHGLTGRERGMTDPKAEFPMTITVPFCPESKLSGIGYTDFMNCVWYKRTVTLDCPEGMRAILHIDACDYAAEVWVNGQSCGVHYGGSVPVIHDITDKLLPGENVITVCAEDDLRSGRQPGGKQQPQHYYSEGCLYTRTTGIWQTVWLEYVPDAYIDKAFFTPDPDNGCVHCRFTCKHADGMQLAVKAAYEDTPMGEGTVTVRGDQAQLTLPLKEIHLWEIGCGRLYDVELTLGEDRVQSYFGLRTLTWTDHRFYLNGKSIFQRLILDQGFYPDGIWTAPSDEELKNDILRSMAMGFNGARLHQKIFEPRFLSHADRLGYLVWGEHGNWGLNLSAPTAWAGFLPEWMEAVQRDYSHPAIIGWCPLNETYEKQDHRFVTMLYDMTKAIDPIRPIIDTSGYWHVKTDIFDCHDYTQDPEEFRSHFLPLLEGKNAVAAHVYKELPPILCFVSEYGGMFWDPDKKDGTGWGYGNAPKNKEEFFARLKGLTQPMLDNPMINAFCYTQLTDVEQEKNGLYTYDRRAKFPAEEVAAVIGAPSVVEQE